MWWVQVSNLYKMALGNICYMPIVCNLSSGDDIGIIRNPKNNKSQVWTPLLNLMKWLCVNLTDQSQRELTEWELKEDMVDLSVCLSQEHKFPREEKRMMQADENDAKAPALRVIPS